MPGNDPFNRCQADPRSGEFLCRMEALKGAEQLVHISHVKPRTIIPDKITGFSILVHGAEFDPGLDRLAGELPGIVQQIPQGNLHQVGITLNNDSLLDGHFGSSFGIVLLIRLCNRPDHPTQVNRLALEIERGHPREFQRIIDEHPHALGSLADPIQIILSCFVQVLPILLQQGLAETFDASEGPINRE